MSCKEIRIGALYPLTGKNSYVGRSVKQALDYYVNILNNPYERWVPPLLKLPDLGEAKVKLIWADTKGDPLIGVAEARRLIEEEKVTSIIGSYQTSVTSAVAFLTEIYEIPYICPDADAGVLSKRGLKWFFKLGTDDSVYTNALLKVMEEKGVYELSIGSLAENTLLGQGEVEEVIGLAKKYDYGVTSLEFYNAELTNIKSCILAMKKDNPDVIFAGQLSTDGIKTINLLKETKYYPMALFDQTSEYTLKNVVNAVGCNLDYVISAIPWATGVTKKLPLAKQVNSSFKYITGEGFNAVNAVSFTGLYVLIDAISRGRSSSPKVIRRELLETDMKGDRIIMPWAGVAFDKDGRNIYANSLVGQIFKGKVKIIWPLEFAEAKMVFPAPQWTGED